MTSRSGGPWWKGPDHPLASTPECVAAVDQLQVLTGRALARKAALCDDAPDGCLRVRIGAAEVDIAFRPTGRTQKICENAPCGKEFWTEDTRVAATTRFCSRQCGNQDKARAWKARHAKGPVKAIPRIISRILADASVPRAQGDGEGFSAKTAGDGTEVRAQPPRVLARCAEILEELGYGVEKQPAARPRVLLVTERKGAAA